MNIPRSVSAPSEPINIPSCIMNAPHLPMKPVLVTVLPLLYAPKNEPTSPSTLNLPPAPNGDVHEPSFPSALIRAPSGIPGHNPTSPFFGTSSPEPVQPIRKSAFCSTAALSRGKNFALILIERSTTSWAPAIFQWW